MRKILSLITAFVLCTSFVSATTIYCKMAQDWWKVDNAAVGCHSWETGTGTGTTWPGVRMTPVEGETDLWSIDLNLEEVQNVIFTRVNPSDEGDLYWGAKTKNLEIPTDDKNLFTITTSESVWGDPGCEGEWSVYGAAPAAEVGEQFEDATSGLKFEVTAVGDTNSVKVIRSNYTETSYTVPSTVKYNNITFTVTEIGFSAFEFCESLTSVTLPTSITTIDFYAFYGCESLQSVTLSEGLTTIAYEVFSECFSLQSFTFPASVKTIGQYVFNYCSGLTSITFLGNACQDGIDEAAFDGVGEDSPATLVLPDNWTGSTPVDNKTAWYGGYFNYTAPASEVGEQFVDEGSGLKFEVTAFGATNTVMVVNNSYRGTSYTVPATVKYKEVDLAVTEIGKNAFSNCRSLQSITIAASVTTIGESAFDRCSSLTSVTLSEGLTTIGESAFYNCKSLQSITLPASVTTMGASAFNMCPALTSATFADGSQLTTIGTNAFNSCGNLQTVTLPAALKSIGASAFYSCPKLTSIAFPASLDTIGGSAFAGCSALESITIPASVDTIGEFAFSKCKGLTSIVVEAGNTKYDSRDNCNGIVEKATNTLIVACRNTIIPNTVTILGPSTFSMQPITTITIPASVTTIGANAFSSCSALQSVTIPAGVTTIGASAFSSCTALQSVTIPASVTTIGRYAFYGCSALASVTFLGNACQEGIVNDAFYNVGKTTPALLTLPANWTGSTPVDNKTKWYGGYFNYTAPAPEYYLVGWINGANSGCEDDYESFHEEYKFVDGKLTTTFTETSYVFVKTSDNSHWYLANEYVAPAAKVDAILAEGNTEKVGVNGNVEVTFTLTENADGTVTLSYKEPVITYADSVYYVAGNFTKWAEGMLALPASVELPADSALEFKQVLLRTILADGDSIGQDTTWFGQPNEGNYMTRDNSTWKLDGGYNVLAMTDIAGTYTFSLNEKGEFVLGWPKEPVITYADSVYYVAGNFTKWAEGMLALPASVELPADSALEFKQVLLRTVLADGDSIGQDTTWYGQPNEGNYMTRDNSTWKLDGGYNVLAMTDLAGTYTFSLNEKGEFVLGWPEKPIVEPKFYVTGNAALVGEEKAWQADAIEMVDYTHTFPMLAAGEYQLKVTDGTWEHAWGYDNLSPTVAVEGLYTDVDGNICFTVYTPNDVTVTFAQGYVIMTGDFKGTGTGLNKVKAAQGQRFNILGLPVDANYRGIVIMNGQTYLQ